MGEPTSIVFVPASQLCACMCECVCVGHSFEGRLGSETAARRMKNDHFALD